MEEKVDYEEAKESGQKSSIRKLNKGAVRLLIFGGIGVVLLVAAVVTFGGSEEKPGKQKKDDVVEMVDGEKRVEAMQATAEEEKSKRGAGGPDAGRPPSGKEVLKQKEGKAEKLQQVLEEKVEEKKEKEEEDAEKKGPWEKARERAQQQNAQRYFQRARQARSAPVFGQVQRKVSEDKEARGEGSTSTEGESVSNWRRRRSQMLARAEQKAGVGRGGRQREDEKEKFLNEDRYEGQESKHRLRSPSSEYVVQAGTMLPLVLETGVNSDLPGFVRGRFARPVYDTPTGEHLLIPAGTTVVGEYSSDVRFGGERAQVVWTRLLLPNGDSLPLGNLPGTDLQGKTGYADKVDRHLGEYVGGVLVSSLAAAGAGAAAGESSQFKREPEKEALASAGETVAEEGQSWAEKQLEAKPTIKIRPGLRVGAFVRKDLVLEPYQKRELREGSGW